LRTRSHSSRTAVRAKRTRNTLRVYSNKPPRCFAPHRLDADDILGRVSSVIASETQQLSWPMPSCPTRHCTPRVKLLGGSRQPMAGRLATTTTVRDKCFRSVHFVCCEQGFKRRATVDDERQLPRVGAHIAIIISSRSLADASSSTPTIISTLLLTPGIYTTCRVNKLIITIIIIITDLSVISVLLLTSGIYATWGK